MSMSSTSRFTRYVLVISAVVLLPVLLLSCDTVDEDTASCPEDALSPSLKPIFYWGETSDPGTWEMNQGNPIGSGRFAQWLDNNHLVVVSGALLGGDLINGLLVISLAPNGTSVDDWELFAFDREIWHMRVFHSTGEIWLLYFESSAALYPRLSRVTLDGGTVQVVESLLDESWMVVGATDWQSGAGVLVNATRPSDLVKGFFTVSRTIPPTDSLVFEINMNEWSGRGFDLSPDSRRIYWGDIAGEWEEARTLVHCLDLATTPLAPVVVADRAGVATSVAINPADPIHILVNRRVYESAGVVKEDVVELLDAGDGTTRKLDVRTNTARCNAVRNEFPAWRGDGSAIVFRSWESLSSSDGPSRVWLKEVNP